MAYRWGICSQPTPTSHRHALQDPHAAQQLSDQLDTLVAAVSAQLMDAERVLFTKLESTLTDYFLHLQQLCRSYAQQQAVLDAGRAMEADLEQFHSITRRVIVQEKVHCLVGKMLRACMNKTHTGPPHTHTLTHRIT